DGPIVRAVRREGPAQAQGYPAVDGVAVPRRGGMDERTEEIELLAERERRAAAKVQEVFTLNLVVIQELECREVDPGIGWCIDAAVREAGAAEREQTELRRGKIAQFQREVGAVVWNIEHPLREAVRVAPLHEQTRQDCIQQLGTRHADLQLLQFLAGGCMRKGDIVVTWRSRP